ncbi:hypothetical protein MSL71_18080 [Desulfoluna butyratoxydans]|uniref:Uncharacterized protein n=1 Tax=Desulfoluna butyratoxydans TaxID=231438 RepID=A0A4U8YL73_9BACT|nr:hypothetical protein MSL71_18080 [Desulfoluna butyratoxydans]
MASAALMPWVCVHSIRETSGVGASHSEPMKMSECGDKFFELDIPRSTVR